MDSSLKEAALNSALCRPFLRLAFANMVICPPAGGSPNVISAVRIPCSKRFRFPCVISASSRSFSRKANICGASAKQSFISSFRYPFRCPKLCWSQFRSSTVRFFDANAASSLSRESSNDPQYKAICPVRISRSSVNGIPLRGNPVDPGSNTNSNDPSVFCITCVDLCNLSSYRAIHHSRIQAVKAPSSIAVTSVGFSLSGVCDQSWWTGRDSNPRGQGPRPFWPTMRMVPSSSQAPVRGL